MFVPIHYLYPTRTRLLKGLTIGLGCVWAVVMIVMAFNLSATWVPTVAAWSLLYPAYYFVLSLFHHVRIVRNSEATP